MLKYKLNRLYNYILNINRSENVYVFLDIDGVLNYNFSYPITKKDIIIYESHHFLQKRSIKTFNNYIKTLFYYDKKIKVNYIIHSTWRLDLDLETIKYRLYSNGLLGNIIDKTDNNIKSISILNYINNHNIKNFVIIDDNDIAEIDKDFLNKKEYNLIKSKSVDYYSNNLVWVMFNNKELK